MLNKIPVEKILKTAVKNGAEFAEIFAEYSETTLVSHENKKIERASSGIDAGYGLRVISGEKIKYGYTNNPSAVLDLAKDILSSKKNKSPQKTEKQVLNNFDKPLILASETAWKMGNAVKQVQANLRHNLRHTWVVNSLGGSAENLKEENILIILVVAEKNGIVQTGYDVVFDALAKAEEIGTIASKRAIMMLSAKPAPRGNMPIIISSSAGGTMVHEAVGHGLEADLAGQGLSVYKNKIGQKVASKIVTVIDDATIPIKRGTFQFDDEGTKAQRTVLIENGILRTYMHDLTSAKKLNAKPTGNGRRESYRNRPIVRMTNTIIAPGNDDPDAIVRSVPSGLFVRKIGGGQVNTINGDFVFETQESYLIENGKVGEPVRGATLIGNGPKILMEIDMVGSDIGYGLGTCGKDGQGAPVGHGIPTIRIPEITVGGTG